MGKKRNHVNKTKSLTESIKSMFLGIFRIAGAKGQGAGGEVGGEGVGC